MVGATSSEGFLVRHRLQCYSVYDETNSLRKCTISCLLRVVFVYLIFHFLLIFGLSVEQSTVSTADVKRCVMRLAADKEMR